MTATGIFNILYFLLLILGIGCYSVLDYGDWAYTEVLKKITSPHDIKVLEVIRNNAKKGKRILYSFYCISTIPLFLLNRERLEVFLFLMFLTMASLFITPIRNLIRNLAIKVIFNHKGVRQFLLK